MGTNIVNTIATLNINGMISESKQQMLRDFIFKNDVDILLLQEVVLKNFDFIHGYKSIVNVDERSRGTAIIYKEGFKMEKKKMLTNGRGISCVLNGVTFVNIYAPSGNNNKKEREHFFANEMTWLLAEMREQVVLGGDFNCVLRSNDSTSGQNQSATLKEIVQKCNFKDVWEVSKLEVQYTYIRTNIGSRLDRIYVTDNLKNKLTVVERPIIPFSDHFAIKLNLKFREKPFTRGRYYWKLNKRLIENEETQEKYKDKLNQIKKSKKFYENIAMWWEYCFKRKTKSFFKWENYKKSERENKKIEMYFHCLKEYYDKPKITSDDMIKIKYFKACIISIYRQKLEMLRCRSKSKSINEDEELNMYHVMAQNKTRQNQHIDEIETVGGEIITQKEEIIKAIHEHYNTILGDNYENGADDAEGNGNELWQGQKMLEAHEVEFLEENISEEEVKRAVFASAKNKSPGSDGIIAEFYVIFWDEIKEELTDMINYVMNRGQLTESQYQGIMVLIKKVRNAKRITQYRPITLLNSDYKIIARIIANRMSKIIGQVLNEAQAAGVPGRTIINNLCQIRDIISFKKEYDRRGYILAIDFSSAFDKVRKEFMISQLKNLGFGKRCINMISTMYKNAKTKVQINGYFSENIQVKNSVRQGCPLSVVLYCITVNALLSKLGSEIQMSDEVKGFSGVKAYADDLTIIANNKQEVDKVIYIIEQYCAQSGAEVNFKKSQYMKIGECEDILNYDLRKVDEIKILGVWFKSEMTNSGNRNFEGIVNQIQGLVCANKMRSWNLLQKIFFTHTYLLSKVWYVAQIMRIPSMYIAKIKKVLGNFLWKGNVLRVPLGVMTKSRKEGGMGLINVEVKCEALYIRQILRSIKDEQSFTFYWFNYWFEKIGWQNPPNLQQIPSKLAYIKSVVQCVVYTREIYEKANIGKIMDIKLTTKEIYKIKNSQRQTDIRIMTKNNHKHIAWDKVWKNINNNVLSSQVRSVWFKIVHDVIPTNSRLYKIKLKTEPICEQCLQEDTILHRLTKCRKVQGFWKYVRRKIAILLRTGEDNILGNIVTFPDFDIPFPNKRNALVWFIGNYCNFIINNEELQDVNLHEYMKLEYMKISPNQASRYFDNYIGSILKEKT